ncbi:hypothetical protein B0H13DRAFT_2020641 [Mycena leptocephala]|nr:hypothetical protein B0H13DRAFT_2020641 [Mycena leptocephala]
MAIHLPAQRSPPQCTRPSGLFALPVLSILPRRPYSTTPPLLSQNAFCAERPSIGCYSHVHDVRRNPSFKIPNIDSVNSCRGCPRPCPCPCPCPFPSHTRHPLASLRLPKMKDASAGNHSYLSLIDATSATNTFPFSPQTSRLGIVAVCRPGARRRPTARTAQTEKEAPRPHGPWSTDNLILIIIVKLFILLPAATADLRRCHWREGSHCFFLCGFGFGFGFFRGREG